MDTKKTCQNRQNTKARPKVSESTHNSYYRSNTDLGNFIVTSHSYNFGTTSLPYSGTTSPEFKRRFENLADASLPLLINIDQEMKSPEYIKSILKSNFCLVVKFSCNTGELSILLQTRLI